MLRGRAAGAKRGMTAAALVWLGKWVGVGLFVIVGCGPIGPFPGGPLRGKEVDEPVKSWDFAAQIPEIQLETRPDSSPYSVTVWCMVSDGKLYVVMEAGIRAYAT